MAVLFDVQVLREGKIIISKIFLVTKENPLSNFIDDIVGQCEDKIDMCFYEIKNDTDC